MSLWKPKGSSRLGIASLLVRRQQVGVARDKVLWQVVSILSDHSCQDDAQDARSIYMRILLLYT